VAGGDYGSTYRYGNTVTFTTQSSSNPDPVTHIPSVMTENATNVSNYSATLNGKVNPNSGSAEYWFEYGISNYTNSTAKLSAGSGSSYVSFAGNISGLAQNTTYRYRIVARNGSEIRYGNEVTFTTSGDSIQNGEAPVVSLYSAYNITKESVSFHGLVNPNNAWTEYWFEYGTNSNNLYQRTSKWSLAGNGNNSVSAWAGSLSSDTTYYYRLVANNAHGNAYSPVWSFKTLSGGSSYQSPYVHTNYASSIYNTSAVLNANVTPNGFETTVWFEYGYAGQGFNRSSSSYLVNGYDSSRSVAISVSGLSPNTRYDFRVIARNAYGTVYGETLSFTTTGANYQSGAPKVVTGNYTSVNTNAAILWATVDPNNSSSSLWFEYGLSAFDLKWKSFGYTIPAYSGYKEHYNSVSGLQANTLYFYRAVAQNAYGTERGEVKFFRTSSGGYYPPVNPPVVIGDDKEVFLDPSVNNIEPKEGETIDYVLTYRNASNNRITGSSIRVILPSEAEYVDSSIRPDSQSGDTLNFYIGNIEEGHQGSIIMKIKVKDDTDGDSVLMFNSFLEYTDVNKAFNTADSFISVKVKNSLGQAFLGSLSAFAGGIGGWIFWILFILMIATIIYLLIMRKRDRDIIIAASREQSANPVQ
jgi:uncharacterized repeat protein (TIGR01451 family)